MNEQLITLASKLILASTSGDQMTVDTISNELSAALTQKDKGDYSSPFEIYQSGDFKDAKIIQKDIPDERMHRSLSGKKRQTLQKIVRSSIC